MHSEKLTKDQLSEALKDLPVGDIYCYDKVGSTNDIGFEKASEDAPDMTVITAFEQVTGRGRMQRKWITVPGTSLPMTVIIRPDEREMANLSLFSPLTGLAIREGLKSDYGIDAQIKWPNDVLINRRKVSGILCETMWENNRLKALILGAGLNLLHGAAPEIPDITYPASSVEDETGRIIPRLQWIHTFLSRIIHLRTLIGNPEFFTLWENSLAYKGEKVYLAAPDGSRELSTIIGLAQDGSLVTEDENGTRKTYLAGEVSLRPAA